MSRKPSPATSPPAAETRYIGITELRQLLEPVSKPSTLIDDWESGLLSYARKIHPLTLIAAPLAFGAVVGRLFAAVETFSPASPFRPWLTGFALCYVSAPLLYVGLRGGGVRSWLRLLCAFVPTLLMLQLQRGGAGEGAPAAMLAFLLVLLGGAAGWLLERALQRRTGQPRGALAGIRIVRVWQMLRGPSDTVAKRPRSRAYYRRRLKHEAATTLRREQIWPGLVLILVAAGGGAFVVQAVPGVMAADEARRVNAVIESVAAAALGDVVAHDGLMRRAHAGLLDTLEIRPLEPSMIVGANALVARVELVPVVEIAPRAATGLGRCCGGGARMGCGIDAAAVQRCTGRRTLRTP